MHWCDSSHHQLLASDMLTSSNSTYQNFLSLIDQFQKDGLFKNHHKHSSTTTTTIAQGTLITTSTTTTDTTTRTSDRPRRPTTTRTSTTTRPDHPRPAQAVGPHAAHPAPRGAAHPPVPNPERPLRAGRARLLLGLRPLRNVHRPPLGKQGRGAGEAGQ